MKRKILILLLCLIPLLTLTGCKKNENDSTKELLKVYLENKESLNDKTYPAKYNKQDNKLLPTNAKGIISSILYNNEQDNYNALVFDFENEKINATLLGFEDNKTIELDNKNLLEKLPYLDQFDITLFGLKLNNIPYFFLEINGRSSLLSDGMYYEIRSLNINNNEINISSPIYYAASFIDPLEVKVYINKVKSLGLSMTTIEESIYDQNANATEIFEITREHLDNVKNQNMEDSQNDIQYGQTTFEDEFYNKYFIKLNNINKTTSEEYEFNSSNLGLYSFEDDKNNNIKFELTENNDGYYFYLEFYYNNANHAQEELWGKWDVTKKEFIPENENPNALAKYKFKNIKYAENNISFDIETIEVLIEDYKDYTLPNQNYNFKK